MDKWSFGLTMMIVGIGGTFLTLGVLTVVMHLLKKAFPLGDDEIEQGLTARPLVEAGASSAKQAQKGARNARKHPGWPFRPI